MVGLMVDLKTGEAKMDRADDIIKGTLACEGGSVVKRG
jgi:hypothetical protein